MMILPACDCSLFANDLDECSMRRPAAHSSTCGAVQYISARKSSSSQLLSRALSVSNLPLLALLQPVRVSQDCTSKPYRLVDWSQRCSSGNGIGGHQPPFKKTSDSSFIIAGAACTFNDIIIVVCGTGSPEARYAGHATGGRYEISTLTVVVMACTVSQLKTFIVYLNC